MRQPQVLEDGSAIFFSDTDFSPEDIKDVLGFSCRICDLSKFGGAYGTKCRFPTTRVQQPENGIVAELIRNGASSEPVDASGIQTAKRLALCLKS